MTIKLAFDFDLPARQHQAQAACGDAFTHSVVRPDDAAVVIVGEPDKCQSYLNDKKTVVFWPENGEHAHFRAKGRAAILANRRLFVVGSEKTPGFFDAVVAAMTAVE